MAASDSKSPALVRFLRACGALIAALFSAVFGSIEWRAPNWLRFLGRRCRSAASSLRAHPGRGIGLIALFLAISAAGVYGWRWYQQQPKPELLTFEVEAPERTCYECDPPGEPNPLLVRFSESAAPIEAIDKIIDASQYGISLAPAHPGQWRWDDDQTLRFDPSEDWPIGQVFEVEFAGRKFHPEHLQLARDAFEFTSPSFVAQIKDTEFSQNPEVADDKKAVMTLSFSHPVDAGALEKRIRLRLFDKLNKDQESDLGPVPYTVSYDKLHLSAFISAGPLKMPTKRGRLHFSIEEGLQAERGGNRSDETLSDDVTVPGRDSLAVERFSLNFARDENDEPHQIAVAEFNFPVAKEKAGEHLEIWLLPESHPDAETQSAFAKRFPGRAYDWTRGVDNRVIEKSQRLSVEDDSGDQTSTPIMSWQYKARPGQFLYARIARGLDGFGGYRLAKTHEQVIPVPDYPRELKIVAQGSLLAMSGPKLLNVLSRDVPDMRVEVSRVLPDQLQHLISQSGGSFSNPDFNNYSFDEANISERFSRVEALPRLAPGKPGYRTLDLAPYLKDSQSDRRGIFLLNLQGWDAKRKRAVYASVENEHGHRVRRAVEDTRLVVVTDLGLLLKKSLDGSSDIFVQSIHSGLPVEDVTLEIIGQNGQPIMQRISDADGHVRFPSLKGFRREQRPVMVLAQKNGDTSFLPLDHRIRDLDLSRFDVGGVANHDDKAALSAYLFSDRGVYRPGEQIRVGAIVRTQDWRALPKGLPLILEVFDASGQRVRKHAIALSDAGFEEIIQETDGTAAAGTWTFNLSIVKNRHRNDLIGSVTVLVRDFQPDRMKMSVALSKQKALGWVSPEELQARISLRNLFDAPAQNRRVTTTLRLSPVVPQFARYADYTFSDPQSAQQGFTDELPEATTDDEGKASLPLRLDRFAKASYQLQLIAQGFEAQSGRGVAGQTTQLVSSMPYLIGIKSDGDLGYVGRDSNRRVHVIAIDPELKKMEASELTLKQVELKYFSTLVKQDNGTFKYESRLREHAIAERKFEVDESGSFLTLDTATPGRYAYFLVDGQGQKLARVDYTVAGSANLSARLEKNAELQLNLSKPDFAPGETLELQVNAPFTGSGLITIERDKVYAWKWFSTDTTASTQTIEIPESLEGNAYVNVSFVRDPGSSEIYTSPLSYGVAPFSINISARKSEVTLRVPEKLKPGHTAEFTYQTSEPAKLVLFAVDEGVLQVARYASPDPLGYLFQKRSLDVSTVQILDLILPDFRHMQTRAAAGGDADALLAKHLNPFKRKNDPPVAYWSGIVDSDSTPRKLEYKVPDHFNGNLRIYAVAVSDKRIGIARADTRVRADFVLSPNAPTFVAPGDEFEISLGISNQAQGSGASAKPSVSLQVPGALKILGEAKQTISLAEGDETSVRFRLKAQEELGNAELKFESRSGEYAAARTIGISVRPASVYRTSVQAGVVPSGKTLDVAVERRLHPAHANQKVGISALPLGLAHGFSDYLRNYAYACTEQLVSKAMPAVVFAQRPEFSSDQSTQSSALSELIDELRARQNPDGAYRYWPGGFETQEFVSVYAQHVLIEARERNLNVPQDLLDRGNRYLEDLASRDSDDLAQERNSAYALYLLTRQGRTMGAQASGLRERLEARYAKHWKRDIVAAYLASAMHLMKQQREAAQMFSRIDWQVQSSTDSWHDSMTADAELLYLASRHFPEQLKNVPPTFMKQLVKRINEHRYHALSAASSLLALDAYATVIAPQVDGALTASVVKQDGQLEQIELPDSLMPNTDLALDTGKMRFANDSQLPAFSIISQSGFDREPVQKALKNGFEIQREYVNADGASVEQVELGKEITVRLRYRSLSKKSYTRVALVDLLPGGFELVIPPKDSHSEVPDPQEGSTPTRGVTARCPVCQPGTNAFISYADFREDRNVFYVSLNPSVSEIVYRIKATNTGIFTVPSAYGEGMYSPEIRALSAPSRITVKASE